MTAIYCHKCGRPNAATAKKCIWCCVPISTNGSATRFDATSVEMSYSSGIERLEDAGPVRLILSAEGIEVLELMPGSRSVKIPADCILEARVTHSRKLPNGREDHQRWRRLLRADGSRRTQPRVEHDAILSISYRVDDEVREGVFYRDDPAGANALAGFAKIISTLVET